jgi:MFS family permease
MHSPIVPVFAREQLAADYSQVSLIGMVNYLPYMFAPFFVGILLDRLNKSYVLLSGILLNVFTIFMLCTAQSVLETMFYRALTGCSCPVLALFRGPYIYQFSSRQADQEHLCIYCRMDLRLHGECPHWETGSKCI